MGFGDGIADMTEEERYRNFWNHALSIEFRQAQHVAYSVGRIRKLPYLIEANQKFDIHNSIVESWIVHARALCEFFLIHKSPHSVRYDFTAADYGWDQCQLEDYLDLDCWWVLASRHLLHFSKERTPDDLFLLVETDLDAQTLTNEGERFYMLALDFLEYLKKNESEDYEAWVVALKSYAD